MWLRVLLATSRLETDLDVEIDYRLPDRLKMAIEKIAYDHVHLQYLATRLAEEPGGRDSSSTTTPITSLITSYSTSEPPSPWAAASSLPLSVRRAYVEWALVLARKLSQALARTTDNVADPSEILACHLMDDPDYSLPGLATDLIQRINKRPVHLAYFDDPDEGWWRISDMAEKLGSAVDRLIDDLVASDHADRAEELRHQIAEFERQLHESG